MNQQNVSISDHESITLQWEEGWKNVRVIQDGVVVAAFLDLGKSRDGQPFVLEGMGEYLLKVEKGELECWHNGIELTGNTDRKRTYQFGRGVQALLYLAIFSLVLGLVMMSMDMEWQVSAGIVFTAALFASCYFLGQTQQEQMAAYYRPGPGRIPDAVDCDEWCAGWTTRFRLLCLPVDSGHFKLARWWSGQRNNLKLYRARIRNCTQFLTFASCAK
ncbi:MAG: hypothetical protein IPL65_09880 [Lewinellaceae bacterium]|nr:hypothetical protein [Lewinellaceae bacterium]